MGESASNSKAHRRRRRWWQLAVRAGALMAAAVALLYATLPWWLPDRFVADRIAAAISRQLGLPVTIGRVELSWREGIRIEQLRIGGRAGEQDMVVLGCLRLEFSPIGLWLRERVEWAEITDAQLRVVIDEEGQVNIAALERLELGYPPERIIVHRGGITIRLPGHDPLLRLNVADLQYRAGRLDRIGRITMSAVLEQDGRDAPVTLLASGGGQEQGTGAGLPGASGSQTAAVCNFRFAAVDISQLHLTRLLSLPLKRLNGRGTGELHCHLSRSGVVDEFSFTLSIENLDAQPRRGPSLPVIERAEVRLAAAYDPLTQQADVHTLRLRLPGIDLQGKGRMYAEALRGSWEALRSLELAGTVNPSTLAALLSGQMPAGLTVDGEVKLRVKLWADQRQLSSEVLLDATEAGMRVGQRVLKPPKRTLTAELVGALEKQSGEFSADHAELRIGSNRFLGSGSMKHVGQLLRAWIDADRPLAVETLLASLNELSWRGRWEITELASLRDLAGGALGEAKLEGKIIGQWFIEPGGRVELRSMRLPAGGRVSVGRWFLKPVDEPLGVDLSAAVKADSVDLSRLRVSVGKAEVRLDDTKLKLASAGDRAGEPVAVVAEGDYSFRDVGGLLSCVPAASSFTGRLGGNLNGKFRAVLSPSFRRLYLKTNATQLSAAVVDTFSKEAGEPAEIVLDFRQNEQLAAPFRNRLSARVDLGSARLDGSLCFPPAGAGAGGLRCAAKLSVSDVDWLLERIPALGRPLRGCDPDGSTVLTVRAQISDRAVAGELIFNGSDLRLARPDGKGAKQRGTALRLRLAGRAERDSFAIHVLSLDLGRSSFSVSGTGGLTRVRKLPPRGTWWPPPGVAGVQLSADARLVLDGALRSLLPEVAEQAKRHGLEGTLRAKLDIRGSATGVDVCGEVDAAELAIAMGKAFRKPAGTPGRGTFKLTVPADLAQLRVRDLFLDSGALQLRAEGSCPVLGGKPLAAHVSLTVPELSRLVAQVPALRPYRPSGSVFLEAELERRLGQDRIKYATLKARNVTGVYRGRPCRAEGSALLENVDLAGRKARLGRVQTDSLELHLGRTHGFVVADLRNLTEAPAGRLELLFSNLDVHELQRWLEPGTLPDSAAPLAPAESKALADRAEELIARAIGLLAAAELQCRVEADRALYFDPTVRAFYEARSVSAGVEAEDGTVRARCRYGLVGGEVEQRYLLKLKDRPMRLAVEAEFNQLMSAENMLAQLAQEFPDNRYFGSFSRSEDRTYALRDFLMQSLDARHRAAAVGTATTITEDGTIRGQAAPKFVTRFLPGLNLVTYRYRRMTGFAVFGPDGSTENDMIFEGTNYDLYIEGSTSADRLGQYEIGVILPRLLESPLSNHRLRQGRVPVLKFQARIKDGQFHDQRVSYPLPPETAYIIFVRNNIVYRLLAGGRKQRTSKVVAGGVTTAPSGEDGRK